MIIITQISNHYANKFRKDESSHCTSSRDRAGRPAGEKKFSPVAKKFGWEITVTLRYVCENQVRVPLAVARARPSPSQTLAVLAKLGDPIRVRNLAESLLQKSFLSYSI